MKSPPRNRLAQALRTARHATGISQEGFGDVSGRTYISQLERGERHATLSKVDDLASVLGIHPASLVLLAYLPSKVNEGAIDSMLATVRAELVRLTSKDHGSVGSGG
jgi:transcriptional regulator with XRE-family HTH domain